MVLVGGNPCNSSACIPPNEQVTLYSIILLLVVDRHVFFSVYTMSWPTAVAAHWMTMSLLQDNSPTMTPLVNRVNHRYINRPSLTFSQHYSLGRPTQQPTSCCCGWLKAPSVFVRLLPSSNAPVHLLNPKSSPPFTLHTLNDPIIRRSVHTLNDPIIRRSVHTLNDPIIFRSIHTLNDPIIFRSMGSLAAHCLSLALTTSSSTVDPLAVADARLYWPDRA
eukprot:TRINITY_DN36060_c0_g1_i2.p2 TRINITY_DN36060_c0_g1~~TRINITY_DN36060_c0_g1_i2.p2  ORF type:complete len:220 (+),score=3.10 TRINITY_DN36060_c0_g1_i2:74-733(+)